MANPNVKTLDIDGVTFYIRRMDPFTATDVMADLQGYFAGPLASVGEAIGFSEAESNISEKMADDKAVSAVIKAIEDVSKNLSSKTLRRVYDLLLFGPECISFSIDGNEPQRLKDSNKAQALQSMPGIIDLIVGTVTHNYADFLSQMLDRFGAAGQLKGNLPDNSATN